MNKQLITNNKSIAAARFDTVGVAGSIPVEPTILSPFHADFPRENRKHEKGFFSLNHLNSLIFTFFRSWGCEKGVNGSVGGAA